MFRMLSVQAFAAVLSLTAFLQSTAVIASDKSTDSTAKKPLNVLFIAVDDLRPEFGAYGADYVHTPNMDRIAKRGVTFRKAYCQQAVCSPTRSSLLTGTRPDTTKVWDLNTHFRTALPDVVTLPQHFKNHGYFVQGMGKLYHGGFDDPQSWSVPWTSPKASHGTYGLPESRAIVANQKQKQKAAAKGKKKAKAGGKSNDARGPAFESSEVPDTAFHDGALAEMAVQALKDRAQKSEPFWLGVGFIRPHLPFVAPKKYWDLYDAEKIALAPNPFPPEGAPDYALTNGGELRQYHGIPKDGPIPDEIARQLKHGYYAAISYMDAQVGKVLDELERQNLADSTVIVLWGDHGWKLGEHGSWCKHSNVENDTRVPLLISVPGLKTAGQSTESLAEFVDVYPTLAEVCGLPVPEHLEGRSLTPILNDTQATVKTAAFSQYPRTHNGKALMGYSMRTDRYRLTRWVDRKNSTNVAAEELYDHQSDPQENTNIANRPENASLLKQLTEQWERGWQGAAN